MSTNVQGFSGDIEIRGTTFIKANTNTENIAIGTDAGLTAQGSYGIAIGNKAGETNQSIGATAVGVNAGKTEQGNYSTAIGINAGQTSQGQLSIAAGVDAGRHNQGEQSVALGYVAGFSIQQQRSVAIGNYAGYSNQACFSVAIGDEAAKNNQGFQSVAVGKLAGNADQGINAVAIGNVAGTYGQNNYSTAIGTAAGCQGQQQRSTAVGYAAARSNQGAFAVAIGDSTALKNQADYAIAIGKEAGYSNQKGYATAVGQYAGRENQGSYSTAIGYASGSCNQRGYSTALGTLAGYSNQGSWSVAVGVDSGRYNQGHATVGIGRNAGSNHQRDNAVAVGPYAGVQTQGYFGVALGYAAGLDYQGSAAIAIGRDAARNSQPANTIVINATGSTLNVPNIAGFFVKPLHPTTATGFNYLRYDPSNGNIYEYTSDDRVKVGEVYITHGTRSILKLKPQTYYRRIGIDEDEPVSGKESGLMAQDIYYDAPELRHLVQVPITADPTPEKPPAPSDDPRDDPDYSAWGPNPASYDPYGVMPYMIKSIQEIVYELPRSKTTVANTWGQNLTGLIVSADTNSHKTNTTPVVSLSNVYMDKRWYGVVSEHTPDPDDYDTLVDTKGDSRIWVTDVTGSLESGDLVITSNIAPGYAQKQQDDIIRNYTVAKITQDCDFTTPTQVPVKRRKQELVDVTYYLNIDDVIVDYSEYKTITPKYKTVSTKRIYRGEGDSTTNYYLDETTLIDEKEYNITPENRRTIEICDEISQSAYDNLTEEEKSAYTPVDKTVYYRRDIGESIYPHPKHTEEQIRQELRDALDENGQIVWEDTGETKPVYTVVDHGSYKAALVTCKLI